MKKKFIILSSILVLIILYCLEQLIGVNYITKISMRIILFVFIPLLYVKLSKTTTLKKAISKKNSKPKLKLGLILGSISFIIIIIAYLISKNFINYEFIIHDLESTSKITAANFIFVGFYITIINSFLEEFFFRGYIFLNLFEENHKSKAYIYSSILFALYHISMIKNWFNSWIIVLVMVGLITIGMIFNWLDTKSKNFINSWIVHILADSAIFLIGLRLFKII